MKRRHFIQATSAALSAVGLNQLTLEHRALRYGKALAQNTSRKLALLIGVNNYAAPGTDTLLGPTNDVELQRQLLIHRFGFHPSNIKSLTNQGATRESILTLYEEHLIKQAKPGDVVVFHFSGHGEMVEEIDVCDEDDCQNGAIVPYDSTLNTQDGSVDSIMGHSRILMDAMFAKNGVENVTVILDCCYSGGGKRGNVVMRSRVSDQTIRSGQLPRISPTEQAFQQEWLGRLGWSEDEFIRRRQAGVAKGVVITSSRRDQKSADYPFDGFYAGAFTYLLTQHLWQLATDQNVGQVVRYVSRSTRSLSEHSQVPEFEPTEGMIVDEAPLYQSFSEIPPAEAVITEVLENNRIKIWLGGLDIQTLAGFGKDAEFSLLSKEEELKGHVVLDQERVELKTEGTFISLNGAVPEVGDVLQETFRNIPSPVTLTVGVEPSLNLSTEQVAQQLKTKVDFLEVYPVQAGKHVHCILGRLSTEVKQRLTEVPDLPATNSLGLFKVTGEPIPGSFDIPDESLDAATSRLRPIFKGLLIGRILRLLLNGNTSRLNIQLALKATRSSGRGVQVLATTPRSRGEDVLIPELQGDGIEKIPLGTRLEITVTNNESQELYMSLIGINSHGAVNILSPYKYEDPEAESRVGAMEVYSFPRIRATEPVGLSELLVVASTSPLDKALKIIKRNVPPNNRSSIPITEPNEVMTALLADLDSRRSGESSTINTTSQIDTRQVAVVSLLYRVVEAE